MKTLRRSIKNRTIGGVCSGIADYFSIDPVLVRLIFVVLAIFGGAGVIIYVLAWIIMPEQSPNDNIQDAKIVDDEPKKNDSNFEKEFKNVADELKSTFKEVKDDLCDVVKEIETEIEVEIKTCERSSSWWFGIFLIFLGAVFLFRVFGWLDFSWHGVWRYWPILLIFLGISFIPMKRWLKNTLMIFSLIVLLIAMMTNRHSCTTFGCHTTRTVNVSGSNVLTAEIYREGNYASLEVNAGACRVNLFKTTDYLSEIWLNTERVSFVELTEAHRQSEEFKLSTNRGRSGSPCVDLALNENPIWDLEFNVGAANLNLDLSAFKVKELEINSGASDIELTIGPKHFNTNIEISTGASRVRIRIPKEADCRVIDGSFLKSKKMDGFVRSGNTHRTENFGSASQTVTIQINGAVGSFEIIRY